MHTAKPPHMQTLPQWVTELLQQLAKVTALLGLLHASTFWTSAPCTLTSPRMLLWMSSRTAYPSVCRASIVVAEPEER